MRMYDIIEKKRNGNELTQLEINYWISNYVTNRIPDYQVSALLMAIYFTGLSDRETTWLTEAMISSGDRLDLSEFGGIAVDKHSTGGVGDKTTLVVAPLVAAAGLKVAKMSGRGLGHTGGTIDKLEAIPGFRVNLSPEEFKETVKNHGIAVISQTGNMVPADKMLYSLRDVTATVDSKPLIASSVMAKKLAAGADVIVLDVKYGSGAFMKTAESAVELAELMVKIAANMGKKCSALITDMNRPLGYAIGNALEVQEALQVLQGEGPDDLQRLSLILAGELLHLAGQAVDLSAGITAAAELLNKGLALRKFQEMIKAQGGPHDVLGGTGILPEAKYRLSVRASLSGKISEVNTKDIGMAAMILGAGRATKEDFIDPAVGIMVYKKPGDTVSVGDTLAILHLNDENKGAKAKKIIEKAFVIGDFEIEQTQLVHGLVTSKGFRPYITIK